MTALRSAFSAVDPAFSAVTGARPELHRLIDVDAHEGPTYVAGEDALYVTTVARLGPSGSPRTRIRRIALDGTRPGLEPDRITTVAADLAMPNGMTSVGGRLLVCEQGGWWADARLSLVEPATGSTTTVLDRVDGRRLNSPNDVVVHRDGSTWFTDPGYGYLQGFRPPPQRRDAVYRLDRTGRVDVVTDRIDKPNGIAFSPDGTVLYVADSGANQEPGSFYPDRPHHVLSFDIVGPGSVGAPRVLDQTGPGCPDGLAVDEAGRIYLSCADGIRVVAPEGRLLGLIHLPGAVNFTFGGAERNHLYITADTAVWVAVLDTKGA
jgi:gluconolactonase